MFQTIGIQMVSVPGVEADDVIGTLACRAVAEGYDTAIVSPDKVWLQACFHAFASIDTQHAFCHASHRQEVACSGQHQHLSAMSSAALPRLRCTLHSA